MGGIGELRFGMIAGFQYLLDISAWRLREISRKGRLPG
jgi:hypothetical protein